VKRVLTIPLEDEDIIELYRILMDKDAEGALEFLQAHVKSQARDLLEERKKIKVGAHADTL
jgi:hypothetical protein